MKLTPRTRVPGLLVGVLIATSTVSTSQMVSADAAPATSFQLTTCGATGRSGPTLDMCKSEYLSRDWAQSDATFRVTNGVQQVLIQQSGLYQVTLAGAAAGRGGQGIVVQGRQFFRAGQWAYVAVGQRGTVGNASDCESSGGGGGSWLSVDADRAGNKLLAVAGGGGGQSNNCGGYTSNTDGNATSSTTSGVTFYGAGQRSDGRGGWTNDCYWFGKGGGGWIGDGDGCAGGDARGRAGLGARGLTDGELLLGGYGYSLGGYGGGGGVWFGRWGGGGGGGYSGGSGTWDGRDDANKKTPMAGGGSSYMYPGVVPNALGFNADQGYVWLDLAPMTDVNLATLSFDTCATTGQWGPSADACAIRHGSEKWGSDGLFTDNYGVDRGIQWLKVPYTGSYRITAAGAAAANGGRGVVVSSTTTYDLQAGQILRIAVGQMGSSPGACTASGGGGGTFVFTDWNTTVLNPSASRLLLAAGGGGGLNSTGSNCNHSAANPDLMDASTLRNGKNAQVPDDMFHGGTGGQGGGSDKGSEWWRPAAGSGAGWLSDGRWSGSCCDNIYPDARGISGLGGRAWYDSTLRGGSSNMGAQGGFGGGGGAPYEWTGGGGGGGYSGGGGAWGWHQDCETWNTCLTSAGGGGGSYSEGDLAFEGYNAGQGWAKLAFLGQPVKQISAAAKGPDAVDVSWSLPQVLNMAQTTGYVIQYQTGNGSWTTYAQTDATVSSQRLTGFACGSKVRVRVAALTPLGISRFSEGSPQVLVGSDAFRICPANPLVSAAGGNASVLVVGASTATPVISMTANGSTSSVPVNSDGTAFFTIKSSQAGKVKLLAAQSYLDTATKRWVRLQSTGTMWIAGVLIPKAATIGRAATFSVAYLAPGETVTFKWDDGSVTLTSGALGTAKATATFGSSGMKTVQVLWNASVLATASVSVASARK